ncbi:DUF2278 family protein [Chlorobium sp. N1]|uniref:DUF2278 family protein n=1 Tax=Chlorobium sp. N1 TaxID=2491138 RepID=UPI00103ADE51|nr:DUF2278 family protein [Chlorobium sp. N1]TCD47884.1 DUF2278 family protein [Chlorobium sp. N1]
MPLNDGYGVLCGTIGNWYCDRSRVEGEYFHCNLRVRARGRYYRCPVDLDSKQLSDGLQWRIVDPVPPFPSPLERFADGWHPLASRPGTGAIDYYRSPELQVPDSFSPSDGGLPPGWRSGTGRNAFRELEPLLVACRRIFVFGEPFRRGSGVHNIHQNQGDPPHSRWRRENGSWQDGGLFMLRHDGSVAAFLCKFKTQKFLSLMQEETRHGTSEKRDTRPLRKG